MTSSTTLAARLLPLTLAGCVTPASIGALTDTDADTDTDTDTTAGSDTDTDTEDPPAGVALWDKVLADVDGYDIAVADDGTFYVVGASDYTYNGGDFGSFANTWIGRFDAQGELLWALAEPASADLALVAADVGPGGELFVAVVDYTVLDGAGNRVRKIDPSGVELWSATLPARASAVAATADGGAVVGGGQSTGDNSGVAWGLGLDGSGSERWEQTWGDPAMRWSSVNAVAIDGDEAILGGRLGVEPLSSRSQAWLARVDATTGASLWERTVSDAIATDTILDLGLDGDGQIVATARIDAAVVRAFSGSGEDLWSMTPMVGSSRIAVASDGSFALTDGLFLPEDDPDACFGVFSPCPVRGRVVRYEPDQSIRWFAETTACRGGRVPALTPDDRVLVLADCSVEPIADVGLGLLLFAP